MQEQANTVRELRPAAIELGAIELSEDLTEAVEKAEAAYWAVRGLQHSGADPQPEAWEGISGLISDACNAARRARTACYPETDESSSTSPA